MRMQSIDIVIAWVDGQDLQLKKKRQQYLGKELVVGSDETRFASNDEIYYNIASILKYVPFVRHIYIVTDQQRPVWIDEFEQQGLAQKNQIQVIDHQVLFQGYAQYLPTFNSLSIEAMLWNIPDISDYFLYLNDDFFFNAPSSLDDFFIDHKMKIYGHWQSNSPLKMKFKWRDWLNRKFHKVPDAKYTMAQMLSADILGLTQYYEIHHRPHLVSSDRLKSFFQKHPEILAEQISHRFRSFYQLLPVGLSNHLAIQDGGVILEKDITLAYLKNAEGIDLFEHALQDHHIKYGCIQSLDQFNQEQRQKVISIMNQKFMNYLPQSLIHQG